MTQAETAAVDETGFICLSTLPKSGTHYTHHFLVNYLRRLAGVDGETLFGPMAHGAYPNRRYDYVNKGKPYGPTGPLPEGVRDIVVQHGFASLETFPGWIIAQTRNPLDFTVSQYHYRHQARVDKTLHVESITDVVELYAGRWAAAQRALEKLIKSDRRVYLARYEDLTAHPGRVFREMIRFIDQPVADDVIDRTINDITADKYRKKAAELSKNPAFTAPLARNGSNRQWEFEMSSEDVDRVRAVLAARRYDLDEVMAAFGLSL